MFTWWGAKPVRVRVLLAVALPAAALTLGGIPAVSASASASASGVPIAAPLPGPAAGGPASSPGHSPVPVYSSANSVSCPRVSFCLAVGAYNANDDISVLTESWNGSSWSVVPNRRPQGAVGSQLDAISCASASRCVAVGSFTDSNAQRWALAEMWNGSSWTVVRSPVPKGGTDVGLNGVSCVSASFCVAVGSYTNSNSIPVTLTESWNGSAWSIVRSPNPSGHAYSGLAAVSCSSRSACMATGSDTPPGSFTVTLIESWNGSAWSIVHSPNPQGAQGGSTLVGVACPTASHCMAVGNYTNDDFVQVTLAESWDGSRWSVVASPVPAGSPSSALYSISCFTATRCVAVGHSYSATLAAKDETLAESWNGSSFAIVPSPSPSTTSALYGVSCPGPTTCLAGGLFYDSSDRYQSLAEAWNGTAFSIVNQDGDLPGVSCLHSWDCVAVGSRISRKSVNITLVEHWNGRAWHTVRTPNPRQSEGSYLDAVTCLRGNRCVAVGYYYDLLNARKTLVETWNGAHWSIVHSPSPSGAAYSVLYGISCTSASQCMAVGSSSARALAESWNGSRWSILPTPDPSTTAYTELAGVSCSSGTHCLAVGYDTDTYYHADVTVAEEWNGSSWSMVPSAAPGENLARSSVLHGVSCSPSGGCLAVGYRERNPDTFATFSERWTGHSWVAVPSPSPAGSIYSELSGISCLSTGRCLAVGDYFERSARFVPLSERWSGTKWRPMTNPKDAPLRSRISYLQSVSCGASFTCLATGARGNPANLHARSQLWNGTGWHVIATGRR